MHSCGECCECSGSNRGNGSERAFVAWHGDHGALTLGYVTRRIVAAFLGVMAILVLTPDRLSGEPTTTTGFFPTRQRPSPLSLYARRPGAKFEDVEARPSATVNLGFTQVALVRWSIQPHSALPGRSVPAGVAKYEKLGLVDGYAPSATSTAGDLLRVVVRVTQGILPTTLWCAVTTADDGTVLLAYDRPSPPARSTTSTRPLSAPENVDLYFPLGAHRGRAYVTCRTSVSASLLETDARAVWGIDV